MGNVEGEVSEKYPICDALKIKITVLTSRQFITFQLSEDQAIVGVFLVRVYRRV